MSSELRVDKIIPTGGVPTGGGGGIIQVVHSTATTGVSQAFSTNSLKIGNAVFEPVSYFPSGIGLSEPT